LDKLHSFGVKTIIITSIDFSNIQNFNKSESRAYESSSNSSHLHLVASTIQGERFSISFPRFSASFTGTGDFFASLLLAHLHQQSSIDSKNALKNAVQLSLASIHSVLKATIASADDIIVKMKSKELCLIQSKNTIEHPPIKELDFLFTLEENIKI
jgi:pyridoxal/pyridoxine/pyridoxamine kinase